MNVRVSGLKKNNDQYIQTYRLGKITRKISFEVTCKGKCNFARLTATLDGNRLSSKEMQAFSSQLHCMPVRMKKVHNTSKSLGKTRNSRFPTVNSKMDTIVGTKRLFCMANRAVRLSFPVCKSKWYRPEYVVLRIPVKSGEEIQERRIT